MRDTPKSTGKKDKPMTSVLLPEGELRVARCDMLDKLIAVGDGDAALLYLYILRHGGTDGSAAAPTATNVRHLRSTT